MEIIDCKLSKSMILEASNFEKLRDSCKTFLQKNNLNFDKFTIVSHDSFIGYITELLVGKYIKDKYLDKGIIISSWEDEFDLVKIKNILKNNLEDKESIQYIKNYFYDLWDLKITNQGKEVRIDVKTALTAKQPNSNWNFLYPVVQVNKKGKDCMILSYYVADSVKNITSLNKLVIIGYTTQKLISKCQLIKQGEKTKFGTTSQIDNYQTELSENYRSIDIMINYILSRT